LVTVEALFAELTAKYGSRVRRDEPLTGHTTLRLGGPAELWLAVESVAELVEVVQLVRRYPVPFMMLGGGANLLLSDAGVAGLVIENRARRVEFPGPPKPARGQLVTVTAESGVILPNLARRCIKQGLSGLEWAVGVPGTVGGAVVNNAGAYGSDMAQQLRRAELLAPDGERGWYPAAWFAYDYRYSRLKYRAVSGAEPWVVLGAELQLSVATPEEVASRTTAFNERRKASQPAGATIGSMFKNPPGDYAGRLIEAAGLKGYRWGQAQISPLHANFFQNLGGARAAEMMHLIRTARQAVQDQFGITLELEIEVVGEFDET
jgi:UDP-N-acetylmuramate dehydrogenase